MLYSIEAELIVLGTLLATDCYYRVDLVPEDFYRKEHQEIFSAVKTLSLSGETVDHVTVAEYLQQQGKLKEEDLQYIAALDDSTPNLDAYVSVIKSKSRLRQLYQVCKTAEYLIHHPEGKKADEIIAETQTNLDKIIHSAAHHDYSWMDVLSQADETIQLARERAEGDRPIGVPTGLPALDDRIGGLPNGRLIILAGRPSLGKTAFALQCVLNAAKRDYKIGFCSLEMNADELGIRSYANCLDVNGTALTFGDKHTIEIYSNKLPESGMSRYKIWLDDSTYSLSGIISKAHAWKHQHEIDLFVVDHIGLVEHDADNANTRLGDITRTLKKLSKQLHIPVLALCQLNRSMEKEKRRPRLSDLRDSGNIEQDCDVALFLHSDDDGEDSEMRIEIGALKTRYGKKGWLPNQFIFDGRTQKFKERTGLYAA